MASDDPAYLPTGGDPSLPPPAAPPAGSVAFEHFQVALRADNSPWELGRGAMGVTYRAFDTRLRTEVALKVIRAEQVKDESTRRRFQREARAAAKVRHPNIASVLYLGDQEGEFFYAMDFVPGRSLEELLKETAGPLPTVVALALAAQAAAALNAAHRREVVHRDLKPANLMLLEGEALDHEDERTVAAGNRLLKVIDFGLARSFGAGRLEESDVTQRSGGFIGTLNYASPEQCGGADDLDGRSDLYSLGIILWRMLTGRLPFAGNAQQVLGMHQYRPPPFEHLAGLPEPVIELLRGLLVKDPAERQPQTAAELRTTLDHLVRARVAGGGDGELRPPPGPGPGDGENAGGTRDTTVTPNVGTTLVSRYRLGREAGAGDGGRLFAAADNAAGGRSVALKLLPPERLAADPNFAAQVEAALESARLHPHPVLLAHGDPAGLQRSGDAVFYVREWTGGFSLHELLPARDGQLRAGEVFRLLDALPAALDHAVQTGAFPWLSLGLHKLFVAPPPADDAGGPPPAADHRDWPGLRTLPVEGWPAFALRLNPLDFPPAASVSQAPAGLTLVDGLQRAADFSPAPIAAYARLVRELLGGQPTGLTPLPALNAEANAALRRAAQADRDAYPTVTAFAAALRAAAGGGATAGPPSPPTIPVPETATETQVDPPPPPPVLPETALPPRPEPAPAPAPRAPLTLTRAVAFCLAAALLLGAGLIWWQGKNLSPDPRPDPSPPSPVPLVVVTPTPGPIRPTGSPRPAATPTPSPQPTSPPTPAPASTPSRPAVGQNFRNAAGADMVWIRPGTFTMGSPDGKNPPGTAAEEGRFSDETAHPVTLKKGYWMGKTEVTQALYQEVMGSNPSYFKNAGPDAPVENVSWDEAKTFCDKLNTRERAAGRLPMGYEYGLPTEARWEYACRAGTAGAVYNVDTRTPWKIVGENNAPALDAIAWYGGNSGVDYEGGYDSSDWKEKQKPHQRAGTHPVGQKLPNDFGLCDTIGNVWEWCEDWSGNYPAGSVTDPKGPGAGSERVYRGGGWFGSARIARSASRYAIEPGFRNNNLGFRLALVPSGE